MLEKLTKWFLFGVVIALLPILFNYFQLRARATPATFDDITGRGELLLVAAGIAAAAVGDLLGTGPALKTLKVVAGAFSVIILMTASLFFADVAAGYIAGQKIDAHVVGNTSLILLACAVAAGGGCVALAEVSR
jgi:hypothetical protein